MWSLGRLKIQEASEEVTKGGIMFPSFKTYYIEENTKMGEEDKQFSTEFTLKCLGALEKRRGALRRPEKHPVHTKSSRRMAHLA